MSDVEGAGTALPGIGIIDVTAEMSFAEPDEVVAKSSWTVEGTPSDGLR